MMAGSTATYLHLKWVLPALLAALLPLAFPVFAQSSDQPYTVVAREDVIGAGLVQAPWGVPLQKSITRVSPDPAKVKSDVARSVSEGCMAWGERVVQPPCIYGDKSSNKTVVLFGDSRAQQFFPALEKIALERSWRLVVLIRANCFPAMVQEHEYFCDLWRRNSLARIVSREKPWLTILGSATKGSYVVTVAGRQLTREESQPYLVRGMIKTIRKLRSSKSKVLILRDQSLAPFRPSECVLENYNNLGKCSFRPTNRTPRAFELTAAIRRGVPVIDPQSMFCSRYVCPAVIGDALVHRDNYHITDTYAETMKPWLAKRLNRFGFR